MIKNSMIVRCVMMLFIIMQLVAILPHHHHGESDAACFNPLHCMAMHEDHVCADSDDLCDNHYEGISDDPGHPFCGTEEGEHKHDGENSHCVISHIDMIIPARENENVKIVAADALLLPVLYLQIQETTGYSKEDHILECDCPRHPKPEGVYTEYISRAIPPRAPTFTV